MHKKVNASQTKIEKEEKSKTFPVGYVRMCLEPNLPGAIYELKAQL